MEFKDLINCKSVFKEVLDLFDNVASETDSFVVEGDVDNVLIEVSEVERLQLTSDLRVQIGKVKKGRREAKVSLQLQTCFFDEENENIADQDFTTGYSSMHEILWDNCLGDNKEMVVL